MYGKYNLGRNYRDKILQNLNNMVEPGDRELFWNNEKFTSTKLFLIKVLFYHIDELVSEKSSITPSFSL